MGNVVVQPNQTFADISLMYCGTLECAMEIMKQNDFSISDIPISGTEVQIARIDLPIDEEALKYFQQNKVKPGTATGI